LHLPDVTPAQLQAALVTEKRPYVRDRLVALQLVLGGTCPTDAARSIKRDPITVMRWMRRAQDSGWLALTRDGRTKERPHKRKTVLAGAAAARARKSIRVALDGKLDAMARARLMAVDLVLQGLPFDSAAQEVHVELNSVRTWYTQFERGGVAGLLPKPKARSRLCADIDGAEIRALAVKESRPRIARRLRVIALLAEGVGTLDAAAREGINEVTVRRWRRNFSKGGVEALRQAPKGRRLKLTAEQLAELKSLLRQAPNISCSELREIVRARFNVCYTWHGLENLLRSQCSRARLPSFDGEGRQIRHPDAS
jgi:transposase